MGGGFLRVNFLGWESAFLREVLGKSCVSWMVFCGEFVVLGGETWEVDGSFSRLGNVTLF
jgi:hypothetical protein